MNILVRIIFLTILSSQLLEMVLNEEDRLCVKFYIDLWISYADLDGLPLMPKVVPVIDFSNYDASKRG